VQLNISWEWMKLTCNLIFSMLLLCFYISVQFVDINIIGSMLLFMILGSVIVVVRDYKIQKNKKYCNIWWNHWQKNSIMRLNSDEIANKIFDG